MSKRERTSDLADDGGIVELLHVLHPAVRECMSAQVVRAPTSFVPILVSLVLFDLQGGLLQRYRAFCGVLSVERVGCTSSSVLSASAGALVPLRVLRRVVLLAILMIGRSCASFCNGTLFASLALHPAFLLLYPSVLCARINPIL